MTDEPRVRVCLVPRTQMSHSLCKRRMGVTVDHCVGARRLETGKCVSHVATKYIATCQRQIVCSRAGLDVTGGRYIGLQLSAQGTKRDLFSHTHARGALPHGGLGVNSHTISQLSLPDPKVMSLCVKNIA